MPTLRRITCIVAALLGGTAAHAQRVDRAEHHEFTIENFHTESGVVLPKAIVVYGTYGHLNAARDNAVLLPSHYMANASRLRVADRAGTRARSGDALSGGDGVVRQRAFVVAEQYAGAVSRAALSGDDDSRQRRGGAPAADAAISRSRICAR